MSTELKIGVGTGVGVEVRTEGRVGARVEVG